MLLSWRACFLTTQMAYVLSIQTQSLVLSHNFFVCCCCWRALVHVELTSSSHLPSIHQNFFCPIKARRFQCGHYSLYSVRARNDHLCITEEATVNISTFLYSHKRHSLCCFQACIFNVLFCNGAYTCYSSLVCQETPTSKCLFIILTVNHNEKWLKTLIWVL